MTKYRRNFQKFQDNAPFQHLATSAATILLLGVLTACGGSGSSSEPINPPATGGGAIEPEPTGMLVRVDSADLLKEKITAGIQAYAETYLSGSRINEGSGVDAGEDFDSGGDDAGGDDAGGGDSGGDDSGGDDSGGADGGTGSPDVGESTASDSVSGGTASVGFTTTYTLETNVDEYDIVKYNGEHIFIAPSRGMTCCFEFDDTVEVLGDQALSSADGMEQEDEFPVRGIRVLATDSALGTAEEVALLPVADDQSIEGLYLLDNSLVALTSTAWWGRYGDTYSLPDRWQGDVVGLNVYDTSDEYAQRQSLQIEGVLVNSRRTSDGIFVVTRYTPDIEGLNYYPSDSESLAENENLLATVEPETFLPRIERNGEMLDVLSYGSCYAVDPEADGAPAASGYPIISLILQIDPDTLEVKNASCLIEPVDGVYLTTGNLYFTANLWESGSEETLIHQFDVVDGIHYLGSARLQGGLFLGGNRDFRLNESGGYLRAVLSQWTDDPEDRIDHHIYIMSPSDDKPELQIVGQLPNPSRPDEIGKPNEDLFGVRFLGDRAYLVTFEQIDPLYAIDLTDPADPFVAGSLEIPGFSNFLHPVSEAVLMGLGQIEGRVKIEFFDVEDLSLPRSIGEVILDDSLAYSYSEAEWNRKAFTYWRRSADGHRMTIPVSGYLENTWEWVSRLYLFDIVNPNDPAQLMLTSPGFMSVKTNELGIYGAEPRAILHEDAVFWILDQEVFSALWGNPNQATRAR